jgi:subtilisin family serine protease
LGASTNDYDLFVLNANGTAVVDFSNNAQTGSQDPFELCAAQANDRVVIVKFSGAARFLHMQVFGDGAAQLNNGTSGNTLGHACATNALCVAAVNAQAAFPNLFNSANTVESFSSDGPRRVFFNANGTPITAGNFSSTGGAVRLKPDLASADGVSTTVPGPFQPLFFGTSAAAPHAAAIAALLKSAQPDLTAVEIQTILTNTSLDIMAPGWDRDSGAGISLAQPAAQVVLTSAPPVVLSIIQTNRTIVLNWATAAGHTYQPQFTTSLAPPVWNNLGAVIIASNSTTSISDAVDLSANRYYRVVRLQ